MDNAKEVECRALIAHLQRQQSNFLPAALEMYATCFPDATQIKADARTLLFQQRDRLISLRKVPGIDLNLQAACNTLIAITDVLDLQIRRIDELEAKR
jgi:hypothetical protein